MKGEEIFDALPAFTDSRDQQVQTPEVEKVTKQSSP